MNRWEGYVVEVGEIDFTVALDIEGLPITGEILTETIPEDERQYIQPGAIFFLADGKVHWVKQVVGTS